jgi:hypothetical protein
MTRADFMTAADKKAMGNAARTHDICTARTGVARPGKTAKDRANRGKRT